NHVVERCERRIFAGSERTAFTAEFGVAAEDPVAALHAQRGRAVVESRPAEVRHRVVERKRTPGQVRTFVQCRARFAVSAAVIGALARIAAVDRADRTDAASVRTEI